METARPLPKPDPLIDRLLDQATAELVRARIAYEALESDEQADSQAVTAAWLRLWRAQQRHGQLSARFEWAA